MQRSATTVIVNVPPADDEQVAHVFKNRKTGRDVHNLCVVAQQWGVQHSILSQESPLTAVVPKPSEQRSSATMRTKAKEVLISQTCNSAYKGTDLSDLSLNRWLDDMAIQQGVNRVSCQVTVTVVVTDIDVSSTIMIWQCYGT